MAVLTLSQTTNLDLSKLREFANDNFDFVENVRKLFKQVENTVGKGEIARYEQFLFFPVFSKQLVLQTHKNQGLFGKGLINYFPSKPYVLGSHLTIYLTIMTFNDPEKQAF